MSISSIASSLYWVAGRVTDFSKSRNGLLSMAVAAIVYLVLEHFEDIRRLPPR